MRKVLVPMSVGTIANTTVAAGSLLWAQSQLVSDSVTLTAAPTQVRQGTALLVNLDLNLNYTPGGGLGPASSLPVTPTNWAGWTAGPTQAFPRGVISIEGTQTFSESGGLVGGGVRFSDLSVTKNPNGVAKNLVGINGVFIDNHVYVADGATINQSLNQYQPTLTSYGHLGFSSQPFFTVDATHGGQLNNIVSCPFYSGAVFMPNTHATIAWGYFIDDATETYRAANVITGKGVIDKLVGLQISPQVSGTVNTAIHYGPPDLSQPLFAVAGSGEVMAYQGLAGDTGAGGLLGITSTTHATKGPIILDASTLLMGPVAGQNHISGNYGIVQMNNAVTMNASGGGAGTGNSFTVLGLNATVSFAQAGNGLGSAVVTNAGTFKNSVGSGNISLGAIYSIYSRPTFSADTATITADAVAFHSAPVTSRLTSGSLTVGSMIAFNAASPIVGVNTTVTTRTGLNVVDALNNGTLTTQIGVDIAALAAASTNIGIRNKASTQLGSSAQLTVDTSGNLATSGTLSAPTLLPTGLTGATATGRLAGVTTSGAPASGTWAVGDAVWSRDGNLFICITAGTPGTWATIPNLVATLGFTGALYQPIDSDLTTIAGLADPNADRILFWDDSAGAYTYLTAGTNLTITGTTIDASGGTPPNDSVTNAILANMAVSTIKGRVTAGTGDPEDLSVAQVKTLLGYTPGDISAQPLDSDLTTISGLTATTDNFMVSVASAWASRTPAQVKTTLALVKGDVGLGSVDNTADTAKPVSTATQTALDLKANLASPTFTGTPIFPAAVITLANQVNAAANSFRGNNTGSAAVPLDLTVAQAKTLLALVKADVGLGNVDNTADSAKTFAATAITSATMATARLGSGSATSGTFLRGDSTWQALSGGGDMLAANNLSDLANAGTARTNLGVQPTASPAFTGTPTMPLWSQVDGTATHGTVGVSTLAVNTQAIFGYDNTADTLPNWIVGRISGLYTNVGLYLGAANGVGDVSLFRTGAAAGTLAGQITITTGLTMADAKNVVLNATTGTKFGTATSQKMGFWNVTPVIQPASANQAAVGTTAPAGGTGAAAGGWSTAGNRDTAITTINSCVTLVNQLRSDLVAAGLIKGAA